MPPGLDHGVATEARVLMACDGDGIVEVNDIETVYCDGCDNCRPREVKSDG